MCMWIHVYIVYKCMSLFVCLCDVYVRVRIYVCLCERNSIIYDCNQIFDFISKYKAWHSISTWCLLSKFSHPLSSCSHFFVCLFSGFSSQFSIIRTGVKKPRDANAYKYFNTRILIFNNSKVLNLKIVIPFGSIFRHPPFVLISTRTSPFHDFILSRHYSDWLSITHSSVRTAHLSTHSFREFFFFLYRISVDNE